MALDEDTIAQQLGLLAAHRRTLAVYLHQQAELGFLAPPGVVNGIADARAQIARIKAVLRESGTVVEDEPNDTVPLQIEPIQPPSHSMTWPVRFLPQNLPASYVERPTALAELRAALLQRQPRVGIVAATAVHGEGGLGKTVLARAICEDEAIRRRYRDGVLWATLGQSAGPARHQRDWIYALGGDVAAASSLEAGKVELQRLLADRAVLLVLDDIWRVEDAHPLQVDTPHHGILLTTRNAALVASATLVRLEGMQHQESRTLLQTAAPGVLLDDSLTDQIASRLGHLPLALQIVGALLASGLTWVDILDALKSHDLAFLAHGQHSVLAAIQTSVAALDSSQADRYHELVIFPRAQPLSEAAVARLWAQTASLKLYQARRLLALFRERALLQANDTLHDLHVDYLHTVIAPPEVQHLHSILVDTYGDTGAHRILPDDDGLYGWRSLAMHLALAGRMDDLSALLTNGTYLQGKIEHLGTTALLSDFALLPDNVAFRAIAGAIRLGAHILDRAPHELANQLRGRLGEQQALCALPVADGPSLHLLSSSLTSPGGPLLRTFAGHTDTVAACSFSPDGLSALSASFDGTLRLWDLRSGQILHVLEGHTSKVTACSFSPDGKTALSASDDNTLRVWDINSGQTRHTLVGHTDMVTACSFSPDGKTALSASDDCTLRLWDLKNGQPLHLLQGHTHWVMACAFSPDGKTALSTSQDRTLRLWDLKNGQSLHRLHGHTDTVTTCAFSPNGLTALSASHDSTLRLWDVTSGQTLHLLRGHTWEVTACSFSPDGKTALSTSGDRTLRLWDLTSGQTLRLLHGHTDWVTVCAFSPDGLTALSASDDHTLRLWDVTGGQTLHSPHSHTREVRACIITPDGKIALSASDDCTLRVWDVTSGLTLHILEGHTSSVWACSFSSGGLTAISASGDRTLRLWDVKSGQTLRLLQGHAVEVTACSFSSDSKTILSASYDQTLRLWDLSSGQTLHLLEGHTDTVTACSFSPDGKTALSASDDRTLRLWDMMSGQTLHILEGHTEIVTACSFSPDGLTVLTLCANIP